MEVVEDYSHLTIIQLERLRSEFKVNFMQDFSLTYFYNFLNFLP